MPKSAGETTSIRLPAGTSEQLRAATGMPTSTLLRTMALAYLARLKRENRLSAPENPVQKDVNEIAAEIK